MVGGRIIEIIPFRIATGTDVMRIWVVGRDSDECVVYAYPFVRQDGPDIGEEIWWQDGRIFFDNDRQFLKKVGNSESV